MAEFVEQKIQEMIPELEEMERFGLLSKSEIMKLIQRRRDFEYRISRPKKKKGDFIGYVLFECKLLELIDLRRQKLSIRGKYNKIDFKICRRVLKRLRYMSRIWPAQADIWDLRIAFSKSRKFIDEVSSSYAEQIHFHGHKEDSWVEWANWEMQGRNNFDKARDILLSKAPLYFPKSLVLSKEHFRLELLFVEHLKKESEGLKKTIDPVIQEKVLNCAVAELIYLDAIKKFEDADLYWHFFTIAEKFPFAAELRDTIYKHALENIPSSEVIYKLRARRSILQDECNLAISEEGQKSQEPIELNPKMKLLNIISVYDTAMNEIGESFFKTYFEQLCDLLNQCWSLEEYRNIVINRLFSLFEDISPRLSSKYFRVFVSTLLKYSFAEWMKKSAIVIKRILFDAKATHPSCPFVRLLWVNYKLNLKPDLMLNITKLLKSISGSHGVELCMTLINKGSAKASYKENLFQKAALHVDPTVAKRMRVNHIKCCDSLAAARVLYKRYSNLPPFNAELHCCMILKELEIKKVFAKRVRRVFQNAVDQFGQSHLGVWLSYIEFERKFGAKKNISILNQEAEQNLDPDKYQKFIDLKFIFQSKKSRRKKEDHSSKVFVEEYEATESGREKRENFWGSMTVGPIFREAEEPVPLRQDDKQKLLLSFSKVLMENDQDKSKNAIQEEENVWEKVVTFLLGEEISFSVKEVHLDDVGVEHDAKEFVETTECEFERDIRNRGAKLSDELSLHLTKSFQCIIEDDIQKILSKSDILKAGFHQQKQIIPYYLSERTKKIFRKREREKTKGEGWFNMSAPEVTAEVERDLAILKMRSALHPDRHYKRNDMKELPKYFQIGKVLDSAADFYSSRIPKRERKRTLAEEIMNDEEVLRYQKRKYAEIVQQRQAKRRKVGQAKQEDRRKKKNKLEKRQPVDKSVKEKKAENQVT